MEENYGKTEKKSPFQLENEGLRRWKAYLDEKYSDLDMKLGVLGDRKVRKERKNTAKIDFLDVDIKNKKINIKIPL